MLMDCGTGDLAIENGYFQEWDMVVYKASVTLGRFETKSSGGWALPFWNRIDVSKKDDFDDLCTSFRVTWETKYVKRAILFH
jgi:hypothetical protein